MLVCFSPGFILLTLYLSYQYNVRRRKHPEVVEPREERRIGQLPTRHGQANKQQQASRWQRVKTSTVRNRADDIVTKGTNKAFLTSSLQVQHQSLAAESKSNRAFALNLKFFPLGF